MLFENLCNDVFRIITNYLDDRDLNIYQKNVTHLTLQYFHYEDLKRYLHNNLIELAIRKMCYEKNKSIIDKKN